MGIVSRLGYGRFILGFAVVSVSTLCAQQLALASPEPVEITLTHPSKPSIKIKVDKAYLPSAFLALVRENRKGGEHRKVMLDVSYPSMKPLSKGKANLNQWKSILFLSNTKDNFVLRHFKRRKGKRFKEVESDYIGLKKFILFDLINLHPSMEKIQSDDIIYYHEDVNNKYSNHIIFCQYAKIINSKCDANIQLKSGMLLRYQIPLSKISEWKSIYGRFREFSATLEAQGE